MTLVRAEKLTVVDVGHFGRRDLLVNTLESHGLDPTDIERMILTHAHWDHCQNTDLFPNAELVIHAKELEYSRNPRAGDYATARYFADTLTAHTVVEVKDDTQIESGVGVFDTPGHTRGHHPLPGVLPWEVNHVQKQSHIPGQPRHRAGRLVDQ